MKNHKITLITILLISAVVAGCYQKTSKRSFLNSKRSPKIVETVPDKAPPYKKTDIHFNKKYCAECHTSLPTEKEKSLKHNGNFKYLCKCHYQELDKHIHPVDITPSAEMASRIAKDLPLKNGKLSCDTCHDIFLQCQEKNKILKKGDMFLRETPSQQKYRLCFKCHDKNKYKIFNPHKQLDTQKNIIKDTCMYCHTEYPDVDPFASKGVKLLMTPELLCIRCHTSSNKKSLHDRHNRTPSYKVATRIKETEKKYNIILPLTKEGRLTCITCHTPHEKGVIPENRKSAKGSDRKHKHRLPVNFCTSCHKMPAKIPGGRHGDNITF